MSQICSSKRRHWGRGEKKKKCEEHFHVIAGLFCLTIGGSPSWFYNVIHEWLLQEGNKLESREKPKLKAWELIFTPEAQLRSNQLTFKSKDIWVLPWILNREYWVLLCSCLKGLFFSGIQWQWVVKIFLFVMAVVQGFLMTITSMTRDTDRAH